MEPRPLDDHERDVYSWQITVPGFGEEGQEKLRGASVMISRLGGLGSVVAYELAAAGVGRLVLAHGGDIRPSDLNRQLLMTHGAIGTPRMDSVRARLLDLNPRLELVCVSENVSPSNVDGLADQADVIVDCAPLFDERFRMNDAAFQRGIPLVEPAMYELQAQVTTFIPGKTGCLRCLYPEAPPAWRRRFPVFGAVSGTVGCIAAMEAIKLLAGLGEPLANRLLTFDLRDASTKTIRIGKREGCPTC